MASRLSLLRLAAAAMLSLSLAPVQARAQAENVPASHPVYQFLKRMAVKGVIERYSETVLPMGRRDVAAFLAAANARRKQLSAAERGWLDDYLSEFQYDLTGGTEGFYRLIDPEPTAPGTSGGEFSDREKFLYHYHDSAVSFFVNGLVDLDARGIRGDDLGSQNAEYLQLGARMRGSIWGKVGYYLQLTNAGFRGSRELLARDPILSQSHELAVTNARNFDFAEGYVRYDGGIISAEAGRERVLWGSGYGEKVTLSDNVGLYDFLRVDAHYKALRYTFLHAWLSGPVENMAFKLPFDTSATFVEPVAADKFFASHRLELSFPKAVDLGFQEMVVYSNRAPDLAYLNPVTVFEPAQRARGERDNMFWLFDLRTHFIPNLEFTGSMLYDDINLPDLFSGKWSDRYGWQAGMFYADMFNIPNTSLMVEYARIQPYVFSHGRSRDDSYTSMDRLLGTPIGANADQWFFRVDYLPERNLAFSARVTLMRKGLNTVDSTGHLLRNVGGDVFSPHRDSDPETVSFLDGILVKNRRLLLLATWECFNQFWIEGRFEFDSSEWPATGARDENSLWGLHLRWEL
jgi:hypothetical protein